ncbi:MAG: hypothetical protein JNN03_02300 [Rubrivivax sp.]|nr:hypothetical protein [Rubrivivax sp.]
MVTRPQGQAPAHRAAEEHHVEASPADRPVLAVLEDCAGGAVLIECSAALARALGRELAVVQVQSTLALQAAALPQTRVLAHAGAPWAAFAPQDVERGWRAQTARLRALAGPIATRHSLPWSLRTVRGEIGAVARGLLDETDLLFLGAMVWHTRAMARAAAAPAVLAVLDDGSAAARRGMQLAARMASGMASGGAFRSASGSSSGLATSPSGAWRVRELPVADGVALDALLRQPPPLDALLMPRALATPERWARLARLGCPVLLIG